MTTTTPPPLRPIAIGLLCVLAAAIAACEPAVDCTALCERTIACEVSFQPPDDPTEERVASGERSEVESCALGCQASPLVTPESAACISALDVRDAAVCQDTVLACLDASDPT